MSRRLALRKAGRTERDPQHGPLWASRLRLVIEREPELEPFAIAERFGLDEERASDVRWHVLRGDRRTL
jgi:hypothetical protein